MKRGDQEKRALLRARIAQCERYKREMATKARTIVESSAKKGLSRQETDLTLHSYFGEKSYDEWMLLYDKLIEEAEEELNGLDELKELEELSRKGEEMSSNGVVDRLTNRQALAIGGVAVVLFIIVLATLFLPKPIAVLTGNVLGIKSVHDGNTGTGIMDTQQTRKVADLLEQAEKDGRTHHVLIEQGLFGSNIKSINTIDSSSKNTTLKGKDSGGNDALELLVASGRAIASYGTRIEVGSVHDGPLGRSTTYRLLNTEDIDTGFIAVTPGTNVTITEQDGERAELKLLGETYNFVGDWQGGGTLLSSLRGRLASAGATTDLATVFPQQILPKKGERLLIYAYPHPRDRWVRIATFGSGVGRLLFLDPAGSWWDQSWNYKVPINVTDGYGQALTDERVLLTLNSTVGEHFNWSDNSSVRFTYYNTSSETETPVNYWIKSWNSTSQTAKVWIMAPYLSSTSQTTFYLYYGNPSASVESNYTAIWGQTSVVAQYNATLGAPDCSVDAQSCSASNSLLMCSGQQSSPGPEPNQPNTIDTCADSTTSGTCHSDESVENMSVTGLNGTAIKAGDTINITVTAYCWGTQDRIGIFYSNSTSSPSWVQLTPTGQSCTVSGGFESFSVTRIADNTGEQAVRGIISYNNDITSSCPTVSYTDMDDLAFDVTIVKMFVTTYGDETNSGYLNTNVTAPQNATVEYRNTLFATNGSVLCGRGSCGNVTAQLQFFSVTSPLNEWTETTAQDFSSATQSDNITIGDSLTLSADTPYDPWWSPDWTSRSWLNMTDNDGNLTDYRFPVTLNSSVVGNNFDWNNDNSSLRFLIYNGTWTQLSQWIESWDVATNTSTIWLSSPRIPHGSSKLYYYYSNPSATMKSSTTGLWEGTATASYDASLGAPLCAVDTESCVAPSTLLECNSNQNTPEPNGPNTIDTCADSTTSGTCHSDESVENMSVTGLNGTAIKAGDTINITVTAYCWGTKDRIGIFYSNSTSSPSWVQLTPTGQSCTVSGGFESFSVTRIADNTGEQAVRGIISYNNDITSSCPTVSYTDMDDLAFKVMQKNDTAIALGTDETLSYLPSGTYVSESFDTGSSDVKYDTILWAGQKQPNTSIKMYVRTSPDNTSWSPWFQEVNGSTIDAPDNRYIQYKTLLSTSDANVTPILDENNIRYRIEALGWKPIGAGESFTGTSDKACGILDQIQKTCSPSWTVTPTQLGSYAFRVSTDTSASNVDYNNITIIVKAKSYLSGYDASPEIADPGKNVTLNVRLLDDLSQPVSGQKIVFNDETEGTTIGSNITDSEGYATITFQVTTGYSIGTHTLNATFTGNSTLYEEEASPATTSFKVSSTPSLGDPQATPQVAGLGDSVVITIDANDTVGLDKVWANVTDPSGTSESMTMNGFGNGTYTLSYNDTWQVGTYSYKISANNTDGVLVDPQGNFTVVANASIYVDPEQDTYKNYETVHLSDTRRKDWWNNSWAYRKTLLVNGTDVALSEYQVPLSIDTHSLISTGKMKGDCSDLRFVASKEVYELPITITNSLGREMHNEPIKIVITDSTVVSHMSASGNDLRVFETQPEDPYATASDTHFWFSGISGGRATIWVFVNDLAESQDLTLHFYYGKANAPSESNYSTVFTTPIGVAGKTGASSSWNVTQPTGITFNTTPVVVGSLTTVNDVAQAALRLANVTADNFSAKAEESVTLDGVHSSEGIGYLALKPGTWVLGGKVIRVNTTTMDDPTGKTYNTVSYGHSFSSVPEVIAQVQSFNDSDPVHTRMENAGLTSIDIKLEETEGSDTSHGYETVGLLALEGGIYETGTGTLQAGDLTTTSTATSIPYSSAFFNPVVMAKIETEAGGDNSHERVNADSSSATVAVEEEAAYDGTHTTEIFSWLASDPGILYGAPYTTGPTISEGAESVFSSSDVLLDYYLEGGCNTTNTTMFVQVPFIPASSNKSVYVYYGNPSAENDSNLKNTMAYDSPQTIGYVVNANLASGGFDIFSFDDDNAVSVGTLSTNLDKRGSVNVPSSAITMATPVKAKSLIQADSATDYTDIISPSSWAGKEFIYFNYRGTDYFDAVSPWGTANVTLYDGATEVWNGNIDASGTTIAQDISNTNVTRIVSDIPILVQHRTSNGDAYPLYPATSDPLYGVPGNYLLIGAGTGGANVTANSSGATQTAFNLASYGTYGASGYGADGSGVAYRLVPLNASQPIGALQQADSDGRETTTFLPAKQLGTLFGSSKGAAGIAIAAPTLGTNCTLYNGSGATVASALSSGNGLISKIGFGTGSDAQNVGADWIIECDHPVLAYFDEYSKQDETQLMSYKDMRQYYYPEPTASVLSDSEERAVTGLQNLGDTNMTGYLYLAVQDNSTGSWKTISPPVFQDIAPRTVAPGTTLNISQIWDDSGAWSTSTRQPGWYRVYATLEDNASNILYDSRGLPIMDTGIFEIVKALLRLNNLTHENAYEYGLDEYEVGDIINWVNVTVQALNNTAISASIDLALINGSGQYPGWGPNSSQGCGNIAEGGTCTRKWDNSGGGYAVPDSVPSGTYTFAWLINMTSENGPANESNTFKIRVHNTPSTFESALSPTRIFTGGGNVTYTFNFTNLWSENFTGITARLNIPAGIGLNASCAGGGVPTGDGACTLNSLENNSEATFLFDVNANSTATQGDYYLNITLNYTNPGGETRNWIEQEPLVLEVRNEGIIAITLIGSPAKVTRGQGGEITANINNTALTTSVNVTANYTLPSPGWTNLTALDAFFDSLAPNATEWRNLTFATTTSAALGPQQTILRSASATGQVDFKYIDITVYATTYLGTLAMNDTNASRTETVSFNATLRYDNSTPISDSTIKFRDTTDNITMGSAVTNLQGVATISYTLPANASVGLHTINISYAGSETLYTLSSSNATTLDVGLKPVINTLFASPNPQGQGSNVTLYANVTDDDSIDTVLITVTAPNGTTLVSDHPMTPSAGLYTHIFNKTWMNGTYSFTIWANDTTGSTVQNTSAFLVQDEAFLSIQIENETYTQNQEVALIGNVAGWWWNRSWKYRKEYTFTEQDGVALRDAQVNITIDTATLISAGKLQSDCSDLRLIYVPTRQILPYWLASPCDSNETDVWFALPSLGAHANGTVSIYYAGPNSTEGTDVGVEDLFSGVQYVASSALATSDLDLVGMYNNTTVCAGQICHVVNASHVVTIANANISQNTSVKASKPVSSAFEYAGAGSPLTPLAWRAKRFTFPAPRGTQSLGIVSPWGSANVTLYDSGGAEGNVVLQKGQATDITYGATTGAGLQLISNESVVVHYEDNTGNNDFMPLYPESNSLYGVTSSGNYPTVACSVNNTGLTVYLSNGTNYTATCNQYTTYTVPKGGSQGQGPAVHIVANTSGIGAMDVADGDGTEGVTYLQEKALGSHYVIPQDAEYITLTPHAPSTNCVLRNPSGTILGNQTSTTYAPPRPQGVIRFTGAPIPAGSDVECNATVWAYYEWYQQNTETNLLSDVTWRNVGPSATAVSEGNETTYGSLLSNTGNTDVKGSLKLLVQTNASGVWSDYATVLDDTTNGTIRTIGPGEALDIGQLWNTTPWNTGNAPAGTYRAYAALVAPDDTIISSSTGPLWNFSTFNISQASLILNLTSIMIYDVNDTLNKHIYTGNLTGNGTNRTFNLIADRDYRVEVHVANEEGSTIWNLRNDAVTHSGLDSEWTVENATDIWYENASDPSERDGGTWNGTVGWNTGSNGGLVVPGTSVVFSYVLNLSGASAGTYPVRFTADDPIFLLQDQSAFNILIPDKTPPSLFNETYNLTNSSILRGESTTIYARWNKTIENASAEYNSTSPLLMNHTVTLPSPNPQNWTNYTIATTSVWTLGVHTAKLYASDQLGNWNTTLDHLNFTVSGLARVTDSSISNSTIQLGDNVTITCTVKDSTDNNPVAGYYVSFYNGTGLLGTNTTNATGNASWTYWDLTPGIENLTCNITANATRYYQTNTQNKAIYHLTTTENVAPYADNVSSNVTIAHKGDTFLLSALWHDNFQLQAVRLAVNSTGSWQNVSNLSLSGTQAWANFSYTIPTSMWPGVLGWQQYGNDTSGNANSTAKQSIDVWGWATVESISLSPSFMYTGDTTNITCRVVDKGNNTGIAGYNVSFYNSTGLLGTNTTNATGYARWRYTDLTAGIETITCNITDDATKKYNVSSPNNKTADLTTGSGGDITPPQLAGQYELNTTTVRKGGSILISALWNEQINRSLVRYNSTSTTLTPHDLTPPFTGNWTNYTITTNASWLLGTHTAKLEATDMSNNTNSTLSYLHFNVTATSEIAWVSPPNADYKPGQINLTCRVTEQEDGQGIGDYTVYFYNSTGSLLGTPLTNASGYATLHLDASSYSGSQQFSCRIFSAPSMFYYIGSTFQDQATLFFDGQGPSISLVSPADGNTTTSPTITLSFLATDNRDANMSCNVTVDSSNYSSTWVLNNTQKDIQGTFGVGLHRWNVTCTDDAGNVGTSQTWSFNITSLDTTPPSISLVSPADRVYINTSTETFEYNVSDSSGVGSCVLYLDDQLNSTHTSPTSSDSFEVTGLGEGQHTWSVGCNDSFGNSANATSRTFTVDTVPPREFSLLSPQDGTVSENTTPTLSWQQPTEANFWNYTLQVSLSPSFLPVLTTNYVSFTQNATSRQVLPLAMNHVYYWRVIVADKAGWTRTSNTTFSYITDNESPVVLLLNPPDGGNEPSGNVTLVYEAKDNALSNCTLYTNLTGSWLPNATDTNATPWKHQSFILNGLPTGLNLTFLWNVLCYDSLGNYGWATTNRTVRIGPFNETQGNQTVPSNATVNNTPPRTDSVFVEGPVDLIANGQQTVNCSANVSDDNGAADILGASAVLYHSSVSAGSPDNASNHYTVTSCGLCTPFNRTSASCTCSFSLLYYADPGTWTCRVTPVDAVSNGTYGLGNVTVNQLQAVDVTPTLLDYGNVQGGTPSSEQNVSVINLGNVPIDVTLWGYAVSPQDNLSMQCLNGANISVSSERFSVSSGTAYAAMSLLSGDPSSPSAVTLAIPKQTGSQKSTKPLYWRIQSGAWALGECNGTVVFQASIT